MRLKYQLFLTLLAASAVLIALMYVISTWSFSRGFLTYVNSVEAQQRLAPIAELLVEEYDDQQSWDWVEKEPALWRRLLDENRDQQRQSAKRSDGPKEPRSKNRRGPPLKLVLADVNKQRLYGKMEPQDKIHWLPLENQETVVGYLGLVKFDRVNREYDQAFEKQQRKSLGFIALSMVIISALLSIPLASRLVRPLLSVNEAVSKISSGKYGTQAKVERNDEIGALARNINTLSRTLDKNQSARKRWIAEISHELRTPLAVLRSEVEAVQDGVRKMDSQAMDSIHSEVLSLGRLIDDLYTLSMSDLGAMDYQLSQVNISSVLQRVLGTHKMQIVEHSLSVAVVDTDTPVTVSADAKRLEQLFGNLLQNTLRYTDPGGTLSITSRVHGTNERKRLIIEWEDSSPSVPEQSLPRLFDPLYRIDSARSRSDGGAGLGLSIVKNIVDAHDGVIDASISTLGGLKITLSLPILESTL